MECVALLIKHWYCRHATGQFEWRLMSLLMEIITLPVNNDLVKSYWPSKNIGVIESTAVSVQ